MREVEIDLYRIRTVLKILPDSVFVDLALHLLLDSVFVDLALHLQPYSLKDQSIFLGLVTSIYSIFSCSTKGVMSKFRPNSLRNKSFQMLTLNNPLRSKDQNDLFKGSIWNDFFSERIWTKFGHDP